MNIFRTEHSFSTVWENSLCLRWHILRSYCFVVELTFYVKYTVIKYFRHYDVTVGQLNCRISGKNWQAFLSFSCRSSSQIEKNCCMLRHLHACLEIWQVLSFTDESNDPTTLGFVKHCKFNLIEARIECFYFSSSPTYSPVQTKARAISFTVIMGQLWDNFLNCWKCGNI